MADKKQIIGQIGQLLVHPTISPDFCKVHLTNRQIALYGQLFEVQLIGKKL
jgi:hypothetical protein